MALHLSWDELQKLSVLAAEKADDSSLPDDDRDRWGQVAVRLFDGAPTRRDLSVAAELAEFDAALQRDAKTRQRYLDLARRAMAASRQLP